MSVAQTLFGGLDIELTVYYDAATLLFQHAKKAKPHSFAPVRLCSIQSIELYHNAFLRLNGEPPEKILGRFHKLGDDSFTTKLGLKKKAADHLIAINDKREYLISRYAPEQAEELTERCRLEATLVEVHTKMKRYMLSPKD